MDEGPKPKRAAGVRPDRVRLVVLLYRKKGLGIEEFQASWYALRSRLFLVCTEVWTSRCVLSNAVLVLPRSVLWL